MPAGAALSGFMIEHLGAIGAVGAFTLWFALLAIRTTSNCQAREARLLEQIARA